MPYFILFFIVIFFLLPFFIVFLFLNFFTIGFTQLGFSAGTGFFLVLCMILGSFIEIPLTKRKAEVIRQHLFGFLEKEKVSQSLTINLGGAIIPLFIVAFLFSKTPLLPTMIATLMVAFVSWKFSKVILGMGIAMPTFLPVVTAVILALLLSPDNSAIVAFISGVLGVLIGGDLMNLPEVLNKNKGVISIGGAGVFDGIVLVGIISALLAGF